MTNLFKEILTVHKQALKGLHDSLGIDFNKPFELFKFEGKHTLNKIVNTINLHNDSYGIMLIKYNDKYCDLNRYEFKVIVFNFCGDFNIHVKTGWGNGLNNYYRKADFEKDRKKDDFTCYVFKIKKSDLPFNMKDLQEYSTYDYLKGIRENIKKSYEDDRNLTQRAVIDGKEAQFITDGKGHRTAYKYFNIRLQNSNIDFDYTVGYYRPIDELKELDLIDKSGYNVWLKREYLKAQVATIKANNNLNKLNSMDFSKQNNIIADRIERTKNDLICHLQYADFESENYMQAVKNLGKLSDIYNSFQRHLIKIEEAKTGENNSYYRYCEPSDALNKIVELNNSIDNLAM